MIEDAEHMAPDLLLKSLLPVAYPATSPSEAGFDDFELVQRLGSGGMAEVFRAHPRSAPERTLVIKRILPAYRNDADFRALLLKEAAIGRRLQHPNIIRVLGAGRNVGGEPYIVMEYVDGVDVKRLAWSMRKRGTGMPPWLAVHIASDTLSGLAYAHAQVDDHGSPAPIIHRDISPENMLVTRRGRIKIGDFGVAADVQSTGELPRGKLPYMAPELFSESGFDARADLFAVGVVLWELITGRHLFRAGSPNEVIAQVCAQPRVPPSRLCSSIPRILDEVVVAAISPDPDKRPQNALAMHAALQRVLEVLHPGGIVSDDEVRATAQPHLDASRLPNGVIDELPLGNDIDQLLGHDDDALFSEPDEERLEAPQTTYTFIRKRGTEDLAGPTTDEILKAYLEEAPISALPGFVDTLDLAPGAHSAADLPVAAPKTSSYDGPVPVWLDTPHGMQGPLRPSRVFSYLRDQPAESLKDIKLSANRARWVTLDRFAYLLDDELVSDTLELGSCEMQGRITDVSMTAILGTFARGQTTSRLLFVRQDGGVIDRYEAEIVDGRIAAIHHNDLFFEVWSTLLENQYLDDLGLGVAFHTALSEDRRVVPRLALATRLALVQARGLAKRRALRNLFAWREGYFGSNAKVLAQPDRSSTPILRMLPRWVAQSHDFGMLQAYLAPLLDRPLWRAQNFGVEIARLNLRPSDRIRAEAFGYGRTLFESLEFASAGRVDTRFSAVIAYLLLELGLLHDSNPADFGARHP